MSPGLLERGRVIAVDNLLEQVHPSQTRPESLPDGVELVQADVAEPGVWDELLQRVRPELVVILAAETGTGQKLLPLSVV